MAISNWSSCSIYTSYKKSIVCQLRRLQLKSSTAGRFLPFATLKAIMMWMIWLFGEKAVIKGTAMKCRIAIQ